MHEKGQFTNIGSAENLVLGIAQVGYDPDGSDFPMELEFEADDLSEYLE